MEQLASSVEHPWSDYTYWHDRHLAFGSELKAERDDRYRDTIAQLKAEGTDEALGYIPTYEELLEHESGYENPESFRRWWNELDPPVRMRLMEDYRKGLEAVHRENDGKAAEIIRRLIRERAQGAAAAS